MSKTTTRLPPPSQLPPAISTTTNVPFDENDDDVQYDFEDDDDEYDVIPRVNDSSFLRTIPEDKSDTGSNYAASTSSSRGGGGGGLQGRIRTSDTTAAGEEVVDTSPSKNWRNFPTITGDTLDEEEEDIVTDQLAYNKNGSATESVLADAGVGDATSEEEDDDDRRQQQQPQRQRNKFFTRRVLLFSILGALFVLIVCSAIVAVVVVNANKKDNTKEPTVNVTATNPTDPPSREGTSTGTPVSQILESISDTALLYDDPASSQYQAREWMDNMDTLTEEILAEGAWRVKQRYALVLFYYATNGSQWSHHEEGKHKFLDPDMSECYWTGVMCDPDRRRRRRKLIKTNQSNNTVFQLYLSNSSLAGSIPSELGAATPQLIELHLFHNSLFGSIPTTLLDRWTSLTWLDLSENQLTGSIPKRVWTLPKLTYLFLNQNKLSGRIERLDPGTTIETQQDPLQSMTKNDDPTASNPKGLKQVRIYSNELTGPLPTWLSELDALKDWVAFENKFTGQLPDPPGSLTIFDVTMNNITGPIPVTLWSTLSAPPLEQLYLDHNELNGTIPPADILRPTLKKVWLHKNKLSGVIPDNFATNWKNLEELQVQDNNISGHIGPILDLNTPPKELEETCLDIWPQRSVMIADCLDLTVDSQPPVRCDCCTLCP